MDLTRIGPQEWRNQRAPEVAVDQVEIALAGLDVGKHRGVDGLGHVLRHAVEPERPGTVDVAARQAFGGEINVGQTEARQKFG